jgi:Delta7-sterol 5-desaturase
MVLYFIVGYIFLHFLKVLKNRGIIEKVVSEKPSYNQIKREIRNSLVSIFIFGFSSFPIVYLYRIGYLDLIPNSFINVVLSLIALNIWNEVHFFLVHKLMHRPFFMRNIHKVHHQSFIPTIWSVFSLHWVEAALLSLVPFVLSLVYPLAPLSFLLYPLNSILINFAGHCNYRLKGFENTFLGFASKHIVHHQKGNKNFGFLSSLLDKLFNKISFRK